MLSWLSTVPAAFLAEALNLEMETFHLLDLARSSYGSIIAGAVAIVLADRCSNAFLGTERIEQLERACGQACLAALARVPLHVSAPVGTGASMRGASVA